jgi:hypothetical protein
MIALLGGGFGLYGHLAALAGLDRPVATLRRYQPMITGRPELAPLLDRIVFQDDEQALLADAEIVVLARRPADNLALARSLAARETPPLLVIEKPIGPDPVAALELHEALAAAGVAYRTPYLFLHAPWTSELVEPYQRLDIVWRFGRRNAGDSWKYDATSGGGALAYYFIHFLPVALRWDPQARLASFTTEHDEAGERLHLVMSAGARRLEIRFELGDRPATFEVTGDGVRKMTDESPFGPPPLRGEPDPRLPILQRFYRSEVFSDAAADPALYAPSLRLWKTLEDQPHQAQTRQARPCQERI